MLFLQEVRTLEKDIPSRQQYAARCGYHIVFAASRSTERGGISSGVAIAIRPWLRIAGPPTVSLEHRAIGLLAQLPSLGRIFVCSYYGETGATLGQHVLHMRRVFTAASSFSARFIVAGDYNISPSDAMDALDSLGIPATVIAPPTHTYISADARNTSTIDYFITDNGTAQMLQTPATSTAAGAEHREVLTTIRTHGAGHSRAGPSEPPTVLHCAGGGTSSSTTHRRMAEMDG